jgi:hypothetical protein
MIRKTPIQISTNSSTPILWYRYRINENVGKYYPHLLGKEEEPFTLQISGINLTREWLIVRSPLNALNKFLRNKEDITEGYIDMEIFDISNNNKVTFTTLPQPLPEKIYSPSELSLMTHAELKEIAVRYRLFSPMNTKSLIKAILNKQLSRTDIEVQYVQRKKSTNEEKEISSEIFEQEITNKVGKKQENDSKEKKD